MDRTATEEREKEESLTKRLLPWQNRKIVRSHLLAPKRPARRERDGEREASEDLKERQRERERERPVKT